MDQCVFCPIAIGEVDADLVILRTEQVFALPALRQRPHNHGHVLLLPVDAARRGRIDRLPEQRAAGRPYFHLHVHVVPRFPGDQFTMYPAVAEVPRPERLQQAAAMRLALP
ncbi:MAG: HIT family protein [Actinomycetota bacterium]